MCMISYNGIRRNIEVHKNFKFIKISDLKMQKEDDKPLLNRFEKHEYIVNSIEITVKEEDLQKGLR